MSHVPNNKESNRAFTFALLAIVLFGILLFSVAAHAMDARVLVCSAAEKACTDITARIVFIVPCETPIPTVCLSTAISKAAEVSDLIAKDELVRFETAK